MPAPIVAEVRRFVETEVLPAAAALEHADAYPHALVARRGADRPCAGLGHRQSHVLDRVGVPTGVYPADSPVGRDIAGAAGWDVVEPVASAGSGEPTEALAVGVGMRTSGVTGTDADEPLDVSDAMPVGCWVIASSAGARRSEKQ